MDPLNGVAGVKSRSICSRSRVMRRLDVASLRVVRLEQQIGAPSALGLRELPAQVPRVLDPRVHPFERDRGVEVRGVAEEEDPAGPEPCGLAVVHAVVGRPVHLVDAGRRRQVRVAEVLEVLRARGHRPPFGAQVTAVDGEPPPARADRVDLHRAVLVQEEHRDVGRLIPRELDVTERVARARVTAGERDPERLPHGGHRTVAPGEEPARDGLASTRRGRGASR